MSFLSFFCNKCPKKKQFLQTDLILSQIFSKKASKCFNLVRQAKFSPILNSATDPFQNLSLFWPIFDLSEVRHFCDVITWIRHFVIQYQ